MWKDCEAYCWAAHRQEEARRQEIARRQEEARRQETARRQEETRRQETVRRPARIPFRALPRQRCQNEDQIRQFWSAVGTSALAMFAYYVISLLISSVILTAVSIVYAIGLQELEALPTISG